MQYCVKFREKLSSLKDQSTLQPEQGQYLIDAASETEALTSFVESVMAHSCKEFDFSATLVEK